MAASMVAFHSPSGASALPAPWRPARSPQYAHPPESQPQYAHPPESQPQYAHPPESQPQYAHPPESQPQYAHPPESQPQYAHPPESQPQYAHPPESQPQYAHPPESQPQYAHPPDSQPQYAHPPEPQQEILKPIRRPYYRKSGPSAYSRTLKRQNQNREEPPRHAFFKSFYPEPAPATPTTTSTTSTTTSTTPTTPSDVHVVAMSVSTSVKKGGEDVPDQDSPASASVIHPVLLPPSASGGSVRFRPDWEQQRTTTQSLPQVYGMPEENYEVDEALSVLTNGRAHGKQPSAPTTPVDKLADTQPASAPSPASSATPPSPAAPAVSAAADQQTTEAPPGHQDGGKPSGYVVEGRNYRKYRVEEKTSDGFIVGEYGVVSHQDGSLRGVRYTADSTINPRLIYDALVKFLSL